MYYSVERFSLAKQISFVVRHIICVHSNVFYVRLKKPQHHFVVNNTNFFNFLASFFPHKKFCWWWKFAIKSGIFSFDMRSMWSLFCGNRLLSMLISLINLQHGLLKMQMQMLYAFARWLGTHIQFGNYSNFLEFLSGGGIFLVIKFEQEMNLSLV